MAENNLIVFRNRHAEQIESQKALPGLIGARIKPQTGNVRKNGGDECNLPVVKPTIKRRDSIGLGVDRLGDHVVFVVQRRRDGQTPRTLGRKYTGPAEKRRGDAARFQQSPSRKYLVLHVSARPWEEDGLFGQPISALRGAE